MSEAAGFAAWLHADMHDPGSARNYYRMAINAARNARRDLLTSYMIGSLAAFEIENEDPAFGLELLVEARTTLGEHPPPVAEAWLSSLEGLGRATAHDKPAALQALHNAEQAVSAHERATDPPWPWVFPFDQGKLARYRALIMVRLGDAVEAVNAFADSLSAAQPSEKQRGMIMVDIATARYLAGEIDEAFYLAQEALILGLTYGSERIVQRARRVSVHGSGVRV